MLTPEQLAEFRAECDERLADPDKTSPGFIDITIDMLLTHITELGERNEQLIRQINTDSDVMWCQRQEIDTLRAGVTQGGTQ